MNNPITLSKKIKGTVSLTSKRLVSHCEWWTCYARSASMAIQAGNGPQWTHCPSNTQAMSGTQPAGTSPSSKISSFSLPLKNVLENSPLLQRKLSFPHHFEDLHSSFD